MTRCTTGCAGLLLFALASAPQSQAPIPTAIPTAVPTAFTGVRLIDGTGRPPVENATIVVQNGRVTATGPAAQVVVPTGTERIALTGKTVIPGLINAHGHVNTPDDLRVYAAYGVTTIFSLGNDQPPVLAARAERNSPTLSRARVFAAGPVLVPTTPEEARTAVADAAALGVDLLKIRVDDDLGTVAKMPQAVYSAVIREAHQRKLRVASHLFYLDDAKALLAAGTDLLAHSVRDAAVDEAFLSLMRARGICLVPTLMREVSTFVYESTPDFFADPLFLAHADPARVAALRDPAAQQRVRENAAAQRYKQALVMASDNLKRISDAGLPIAMGTDTGPAGRFQGYFELMELELMVKAGLTPAQALTAATRDAARCMRVDGDLGTLATGRWADFVVLDENPLTNISNVRRIDSVWIAGNRVVR